MTKQVVGWAHNKPVSDLLQLLQACSMFTKKPRDFQDYLQSIYMGLLARLVQWVHSQRCQEFQSAGLTCKTSTMGYVQCQHVPSMQDDLNTCQ